MISTQYVSRVCLRRAIVESFDRASAKWRTQDTEHFQVTRNFLANPKRMLDVLLERDGDAA